VACPLLILVDMDRQPSPWQPLVREALTTVPEASGVFELANLVRSIRFINAAEGNLRERLSLLTEWQSKLPPSPGGYYFRYLRVDQEQKALNATLDAYRDSHGGLTPPMNSAQAAPVRRIGAERRQAA